MQEHQNIQSFLPVPEPPRTVNIDFMPNRSAFLTSWTITTGNITSYKETPALTEYKLITYGQQLAIWLARILDVLKKYNQQAIYPIVSILEPYMEPTQEIDFHIPPKSSKEVIIEVTREGKAVPKIYFDGTL